MCSGKTPPPQAHRCSRTCGRQLTEEGRLPRRGGRAGLFGVGCVGEPRIGCCRMQGTAAESVSPSTSVPACWTAGPTDSPGTATGGSHQLQEVTSITGGSHQLQGVTTR